MARIVTIPIGPIYGGGPCRGIIHVVKPGDSLYLIGRRYHVSVTQLMFANPYVDVYNLQIGDELCIPASRQPGEFPQEEREGGLWMERNEKEGNNTEEEPQEMDQPGMDREPQGNE